MTVSDTHADTIRAALTFEPTWAQPPSNALDALDALVAEVDQQRARADRAEAALAKADKAASRAHDAMWAMDFDKTAALRAERDEWKRLRKQASDHIWNLHEAARAALSAGSGGRETTP